MGRYGRIVGKILKDYLPELTGYYDVFLSTNTASLRRKNHERFFMLDAGSAGIELWVTSPWDDSSYLHNVLVWDVNSDGSLDGVYDMSDCGYIRVCVICRNTRGTFSIYKSTGLKKNCSLKQVADEIKAVHKMNVTVDNIIKTRKFQLTAGTSGFGDTPIYLNEA